MKMYQETWNSLRTHALPQWFRDAKFGIYTHWGIYSVPACGPNGTWYPHHMYQPGTPQHDYHVKTYGPPEKFGYKDFIPMLTAEHFNADEWAELFKASGAQYAGPVAEHHDGFSMWNSKVNEWNAFRMGPKRDVVAELEMAIRKQGLRFMAAMHHAENHFFFKHDVSYDTNDPHYAGLYCRPMPKGKPDKEFLDQWLAKLKEVVEGFSPDLVWFDFGLKDIQEHYKREFMAYYYNHAEERRQEVVVAYKNYDLVPGAGLIDLELGRFNSLTYMEWLTDSTVDDGEGWCFLKNNRYKSPTELIHYLIDNVSKNGYLLLNVDPMPDGRIPEPSKNILREMGRWLAINGEAVYGTTPWMAYGEGPTKMEKSGGFTEGEKMKFTSEDFRFTCKDDVLYAICMARPGREADVKTLAKKLYHSEIESIRILGHDKALSWKFADDALRIEVPADFRGEHAYVFRIQRQKPWKM